MNLHLVTIRILQTIILALLFDTSSYARSWQQRSPHPRVYQSTCMATRQDTRVCLVQDVQSAINQGLDHAYTGQGVLVGIIDTGIEYGHLNFRDPQTGATRLSAALLYRSEEGSPDEIREYYDNPLQLDTITTDTYSNAHGTHTAGIAAGSYPLLGQQGMAPQADLMLCGTSALTDERLIDALRYTFARADELHVPCVINLSIGNPVDWKDGLTPFCMACDSLTDRGNAPGRIIVLSAGNDGNKSFSSSHAFIDGSPVYALLQPSRFHDQTAYLNPNIDTYCSDSLPLSLDYVLFDTITHEFTDCPFEQHLLDTLEASHYGRRHLCLDADTCLLGAYPHKLLAARFSASQPMSMTTYYINEQSVNFAILSGPDDHWLHGSPDHSISDLCCTDAVVSVGAYSAVDSVVNIFGRQLAALSPRGEVCAFSSYGLTADGTPKPDVLCPGASVISSFSSFWKNKIDYYCNIDLFPTSPMIHVVTPQPEDTPWYRADDAERTYYWTNAVGTSQSSPAMAGIIALWLEANPSLSVRDIRDIIQRTARFDQQCLAAPGGIIQSGNGKADALAGLLEVIRQTQAIEQIDAPQQIHSDTYYDLMGRNIYHKHYNSIPLIHNRKISIQK